ncbi:MAG TPA: hypothetical protein VMR95_00330 [Candidatus Binatia bacterium]|nr:hypothetical protein [Candidatus Binatia bacterium]
MAELMTPVRVALDAFDKGKLNAFELDYIIQVYCAQSKELYNFVNTYYGSNSKLPTLLCMIDSEERGEEVWQPKRQLEK